MPDPGEGPRRPGAPRSPGLPRGHIPGAVEVEEAVLGENVVGEVSAARWHRDPKGL